MTTVSVTMAARVIDSMVSDDGGHAVLWLQTANDAALPLAIPCDQLPALVDHCALAHSQSQKIAGSDPLVAGVDAAVSWWTSAIEPQSRELTLSLTFGRGGTLSFALSERMARALLATLQTHYGQSSATATVRAGDDGIDPLEAA